ALPIALPHDRPRSGRCDRERGHAAGSGKLDDTVAHARTQRRSPRLSGGDRDDRDSGSDRERLGGGSSRERGQRLGERGERHERRRLAARIGDGEGCDQERDVTGGCPTHRAMIRGCMSRIALRGSGLVKRYGEVVAVDGLDLEVFAGECFGLLGPNGAGKTTTVEMLEGLTRPDGGTVEVLGGTWAED